MFLLVALLCAGTGTAVAAPQAEAPPRIQLVLDLSGSMKQNDAGGTTRLDAAKQAVGGIVDAAPAGVGIGIRVYGATYGGEDKKQGCQDTQVAVPIGPMDTPQAKDTAKRAVAGFDAKGFTPIGVSLREAAKDLGTEGKRRVILVSDGEDTCAPPPPCEVAKELRAQGVDLAIDVVGFRAGPAAEELKCIAKEGGGTYVEAADAASLGSGLSALFRRQWKGYEATGTPVQGSLEGCADAPLIGPGQYLDALEGNKHRYYRIKKAGDQSLQISGTVVLVHGVSRVSVLTLKVGPNTPGADPDKWMYAGEVLGGWNNVLSTGGRTTDREYGGKQQVSPNGEACLKVENGVNGADQAPLPLELLVGVGRSDSSVVPSVSPSPSPSPSASPSVSVSPSSLPVPAPVAVQAAKDDDGVGTPVALGAALGALLVGALLGILAAGRRRSS